MWPLRFIPSTHQRCAGHCLHHGVKHLLGQAQQCGATVHDGLVRVILERGEGVGRRLMSDRAPASVHGSSPPSPWICDTHIRQSRYLLGGYNSFHLLRTWELRTSLPNVLIIDKETEARKGQWHWPKSTAEGRAFLLLSSGQIPSGIPQRGKTHLSLEVEMIH